MDKKSRNKKNRVVKDLAPRNSPVVKGGATATRFDPYKNFKFRVAG